MTVLILTKSKKDEYETINLLNSFKNRNIKARVCQFNSLDLVINDKIYYNGEPFELPKIVLPRLGAGITRAELAVIRYFELAGITCVNSSNSVDIVRDKFQTGEMLSAAGIPVPTTMLVKSPLTNTLVTDIIKFPCVVKVVVGSFGEGVYLCESAKEYKRIIEFIDDLGNDKSLIVQEYLGHRPGEDLRVFVVGGKVLGAMKRSAPSGDFRANITKGGVGEVYPVTPEIEEIALKTANMLGLDIAGIDLLFDPRGFRVCEANSNPGFIGFDQYCHVKVADSIADFIVDKLK
jgi:gamma-F420-2:alpha-L-glutamate ligase